MTDDRGKPLSLKPKVRQILETAIYVQDVAGAAQFYDRVFGFPDLVRNERVVAYDAGNATVLLLFKRGATLVDLVLPGGTIPYHDGAGPAHFCFAIDPDALPSWEEHLEEQGIVIEARMRWERGGTSIYFRDPDDHLIELGTPGIWRTF